ncbi:uncharacterized protein L969DRAFT_88656 [Mixia osmundae IAM 14324]|uniref:Uncharacterized protein n=1 Tax=Mixia osmundae (strain CBS 9802 / IAM 14324 / JCM 22182 / KY 12970) TaxID=764103 RepID=G7DZ10_MIXOS|nr:uncharacterized protein L969DRAFT_88656 [Mixia osmundae IAM 14324]KEI38222.1 hypothetical protein L969DRAFT_88656 [Mixia osmundae IAM 14324]GAA95820.1 hypothetical protein E5Q_02477 [Mixia osmundae IAM 14324]
MVHQGRFLQARELEPTAIASQLNEESAIKEWQTYRDPDMAGLATDGQATFKPPANGNGAPMISPNHSTPRPGLKRRQAADFSDECLDTPYLTPDSSGPHRQQQQPDNDQATSTASQAELLHAHKKRRKELGFEPVFAKLTLSRPEGDSQQSGHVVVPRVDQGTTQTDTHIVSGSSSAPEVRMDDPYVVYVDSLDVSDDEESATPPTLKLNSKLASWLHATPGPPLYKAPDLRISSEDQMRNQGALIPYVPPLAISAPSGFSEETSSGDIDGMILDDM